MKRRLTIARALINEPSILLLDEPTTGLDPQARHLLWERLYRLKQRGVTLVLTTHYMDEAEQLCDRLVVMDKAKIVAEGSPRQLIEEYSTREVTELRFPVGVQETLDGQLDGHRRARRAAARPRARLLRRRRGGRGRRATSAASRPRPSSSAGSSLEDVFLRLTGRSLVDDDRADVAGSGSLAPATRDAVPRQSPRRAARCAAYEHMWLLYRRTWRGSIFGIVRPAGPVPGRDGHRPGRRSWTRPASAALSGVPYIQFLAPALLVSTVMQGSTFEATFPVHRRVPLDPALPRDVRDAADAVRDRVRADRLDRDPGDDGRRRSSRS